MVDFKQAIGWLKEGKKVRRKMWSENLYVVDDGYGIVKYQKEGDMMTTGLGAFEATDWEIYCEEHEWIIYEDVVSLEENIAEFYDKNPQFGWRGCPHPESYTRDKFCRNCGIRKPEEIKLEGRSFPERIAYLKAKFDIRELDEKMYKIQIAAVVEDLR